MAGLHLRRTLQFREPSPFNLRRNGWMLSLAAVTVAAMSIAVNVILGVPVASASSRWSPSKVTASTVWKIQHSRNPQIERGQLDASSCTVADACTAVGSYVDGSGVTVTLAEAWNGTSWSMEATPNPSSATKDVLSGVSCTAADACTAVGFYVNGSGVEVALAEAWNGTSWSMEATPNPSGAVFGELEGVSCTENHCTAVGEWYKKKPPENFPLVESWNGTSWSIEPTPNPSGATSSGLQGVSCTAADKCKAVGMYTLSNGNEPTLVESWNGTSWSIEPTPNPSGATENFL